MPSVQSCYHRLEHGTLDVRVCVTAVAWMSEMDAEFKCVYIGFGESLFFSPPVPSARPPVAALLSCTAKITHQSASCVPAAGGGIRLPRWQSRRWVWADKRLQRALTHKHRVLVERLIALHLPIYASIHPSTPSSWCNQIHICSLAASPGNKQTWIHLKS